MSLSAKRCPFRWDMREVAVLHKGFARHPIVANKRNR
jgi:hypothetical protein